MCPLVSAVCAHMGVDTRCDAGISWFDSFRPRARPSEPGCVADMFECPSVRRHQFLIPASDLLVRADYFPVEDVDGNLPVGVFPDGC